MSLTAGVGRILNGSGGDRVKRNNLTEFRGTAWEMVTDWFFGYNAVDYDWDEVADANLFTQWTFSADQNTVAEPFIDTTNNHVEIIATSGDADGLSNLRELHTIPETGTWGVSHALCEIYGGPKFLTGNTLDEHRLIIKPQHGIGLRSQEDSRRRTIIAWHDIAIGLPQAINLGVWSGNIDGTGFLNRQINLGMDLDEVYTPSDNSQSCDDDAGLVFDGTAGNWESPDSADYDVGTGDWSVKIDVTMADWTPAAQQSFFSKYNTVSNQRSYRLYTTSAGQITVATSTDGNGGGSLSTWGIDSAGQTVISGLSNNARRTIVANYDADNGGQRTVTFFLGETWHGPWQQLGAAINVASTAGVFSSTALLELGAVNDGLGERLNGRIHQFQLRKALYDFDGNQATGPFADVRGQKIANAVTSFTDSVGRSWSRGGSTSITVANTETPIGIATIGTHTLRVGDRVNVTNGGEYNATAVQRVNGQDCSCTLPGGHTIVTGSFVRLLFSSDSSFDGTFPVTVSGNTMSWTDSGSNISGHTSVVWDSTYDRQTALVTAVTSTTIEYETFGLTNASITLGANARVIREFPYYMELKVEGTVASVRCWGRHQSLPDWMDQDRALICDLSKAQRVFTVTNRERTSNVATLTIGAHDLIIGDRINIAGVEASFNATNRIVTALTATTFSYANTGSDVGSTASSGTATAVGSGTSSQVLDNPCPTGTGRIAFINAHLGTHVECKCVYGGFFGDNSNDSLIVAAASTATMGAAIELETAQTISSGAAAQNITPAVISAAPTLNQPTVAPGAVTLTPAVINAAATLAQPTEIVFVTPTVINAAATTHQPTVARGAVTLTPSVINAAVTMQQPTVARGAVNITPNVISATVTLNQPAVVSIISPAVINASATLNQPTITASKTLTPAVISATVTTHQPTVVPGAVTLTPSVISATATVHQLTVINSGAVSPAFINAAATLNQPTITTGPVSVTPAVISAGATAHQPAVLLTQSVSPAVINAASTMHQPTLVPGAVTLTPSAINAAATVQQLTIVAIKTLTPAVITTTATANQPTIVVGQVVVTPSVINAAVTMQHPFTALGQQITPSVINAAATVHAPAVIHHIVPAVINAAATLFGPNVLPGQVVITTVVINAAPQLFAPIVLNFAADQNPVSVEYVSPDYSVEFITPVYSASEIEASGDTSFSEPDNTISFSAEYHVSGSTPSYNVSYTEG